MFTSPTTSMWFSIFTIGSCIVLFSRDAGGQQTLPLQVTVDPHICKVKESFVANETRIIIQGTLDLNSKNNPDFWPVYLSVQSTPDKAVFEAFCTIDAVNKDCRDLRSTGCYCKSKISNTYNIVVNQTLPQSLNGSYLRVRWNRENFTAFEEFYTPKLIIYPPAILALTVVRSDGNVYECTNLLKGNCHPKFIANMTHSVKLSASGLENPTIKIEFDGNTESNSNGNNVIDFDTTFNMPERTIQANFEVKEGGACGSNRTHLVSFKIISDSPDNVKSSWSIVWIPFVAVLFGAGNTGTSVYGGKRGWFSGLKRKSGEDDVCEVDMKTDTKPPNGQ